MDQFSTIYITFYSVVFLSFFALLFIIYRAFDDPQKGLNRSLIWAAIVLIWLSFQAFLANNNFYLSNTDSMPPRLILAILPPLIGIILIVYYQREFLLHLPGKWMTFFHVIRVPVELVLYGLYMKKLIPEEMTFSGRNFDILIGLSAPVIAMIFYSNTAIHKRWVILWNVLGLAFLLNIVFYGIFSTPYPFQLFGEDQPNIAVLQYPIIWLPSFIVPLVLFFHITCLVQLLKKDHPGY